MGLIILATDKKTELWRGPYSSFGDFRVNLAKRLGLVSYEAGIYSTRVKEHKRTHTTEQAIRDVEALGIGAVSFFLHSDCEGVWTSVECDEILTFLLKIKETGDAKRENWATRRLSDDFNTIIGGLRHCVKHKLDANFC